ncbi:ABC transporter permease [Magnetovibrio sp.]|uniref:ABC transporter permease n=1 Tax=Magnetovibrio sp. TaxID=2024836 RepID=UPI002F94095E
MSDIKYFYNDLVEAIRSPGIWWRFAWLDIRLQYRRTFLGPFWLTLSFLLSGIALSIVYSQLLGIDDEVFFAYLLGGLSIWAFLSAIVMEGCTTFFANAGMILERRLPLTIYALRLVSRNFITFCHNLIAVVLVFIYFHVALTPWTLMVIPAFVVLQLNAIWFSILFGIISTRYRDLQQLVTVLMTLTFFVTPIFWRKEMLGTRGIIADVNPFYHMIEIVRSPMLGHAPPLTSWVVVAAITVVGMLVTFFVGSKYLRRLAYWL